MGDSEENHRVVVRAGRLRDYGRAGGVIASTFQHHRQALPGVFRETDSPPPSRRYIADLLDGGGAFFLAEKGDEVVGFLTVRLARVVDEPYLEPQFPAIVDNLGVLPAWQRKDAGRALMEAAESWARHKGATSVQLQVWEFNRGAIDFYHSVGYETANRAMWKRL